MVEEKDAIKNQLLKNIEKKRQKKEIKNNQTLYFIKHYISLNTVFH